MLPRTCLFLAGLCKQDYVKKNSNSLFKKFSLKNGTQAMKKTIDFGGNPDSVMLGYSYGRVRAPPH